MRSRGTSINLFNTPLRKVLGTCTVLLCETSSKPAPYPSGPSTRTKRWSQLGFQVILDEQITRLPAKNTLRFFVAVAAVRQVGSAEKRLALAWQFRLSRATCMRLRTFVRRRSAVPEGSSCVRHLPDLPPTSCECTLQHPQR